MTKKENKKEKKVHDESHLTASSKRKSSKYRKLIEHYKRRNRLVEIIIACVVVVIVFILACNKTFLGTSYTKKIGSSTMTIDLPRFTYYVDSDDSKVVFKTLRKSTNTRAFFEDFLESDAFDMYYCGGKDTPYYYNREGKYFIYDITVKKSLVIKTITVNYSNVDYDLFCNTIPNSDESDDSL